jgi:enamine deaminase RidA (YjgF/YER057c/UK114 family)
MDREAIKVGKPFEGTVPFSLGVVSSGRILHTAGITARDPEGRVVGPGDMLAQVAQCFSNLQDIFDSVGGRFENVIKFTIFTTDIDRFSNETRDMRFPYFKGRPASTAVEVRKLIDPEMLVEVEAIVCLE